MAKPWLAEHGQMLAAAGTTFKAVSGTVLTVSQSPRLPARQSRKTEESGTLEQSHLLIGNTPADFP